MKPDDRLQRILCAFYAALRRFHSQLALNNLISTKMTPRHKVRKLGLFNFSLRRNNKWDVSRYELELQIV